MHDQDAITGCSAGKYLRRSAAWMRSTIQPALRDSDNAIDRRVVLCMTGRGPEFHNSTAVSEGNTSRRVGYTYYDRDFALVYLREALSQHGRVKSVRTRLLSHFMHAGCPAVLLLPTSVPLLLELLEDIVISPLVSSIRTRLIQRCCEHDEFVHVSMDATLRVAMRVKGQSNYRDSATSRAGAVVGDEDALRRVITMRGRTGAVLVMAPIRSE